MLKVGIGVVVVVDRWKEVLKTGIGVVGVVVGRWKEVLEVDTVGEVASERCLVESGHRREQRVEAECRRELRVVIVHMEQMVGPVHREQRVESGHRRE